MVSDTVHEAARIQRQYMRAATQAMEHQNHRLRVVGSKASKLLVAVVSSSAGKGSIQALIWGNREVHGKGAFILRFCRFEHPTFIVDWDIRGFDGSPECLQMAVKEQWVKMTWRSG